ncbi:kinase [Burkholderia sp. A2]|nr:kinase [Burkholderia sp. A2]
MSRAPRLPFTSSRGAARRKAMQFDRALRRPATYPHPAGRIVRIETHLSVVYLAGRYAYKRIKPVRFAFVDLVRPAQRHRCALAECTLNRPFAGSLYLGVWPIVARGRRSVFGPPVQTGARRHRQTAGPGEYVVRMRRFDAQAMLSARSASHGAGLADADALADTLARHHLHAPRGLRGSTASVVAQCRPLCDTLDVTVRWIDVASDLAFALTDYSAHGRADCAHHLLSEWLARTGDHAALGVLPCYFVYRALVQAMTARLRGDEAARRQYLRVASDMAQARCDVRPALLLCHGVSGSGKSLASRALAEQIGAIRLSSDVERKRDARAPEHTRLSAAAYSNSAIDAIHERLREQAGVVLASGYTAIVDATFLRRRHRAAFMSLAAQRGVRVAILDFVASRATLAARVAARAERGCDASDADTAVLARQIDHAETLAPAEAAIAIRFDTDCDATAYGDRAFWAPLFAALRT